MFSQSAWLNFWCCFFQEKHPFLNHVFACLRKKNIFVCGIFYANILLLSFVHHDVVHDDVYNDRLKKSNI